LIIHGHIVPTTESTDKPRQIGENRLSIRGGIKVTTALDGRFENRSERNGCGVAGFSKRPLSARPSRFALLAICLAGFRVPAGKPASQTARQHHFDPKTATKFQTLPSEKR
jgi:hypothetical protein